MDISGLMSVAEAMPALRQLAEDLAGPQPDRTVVVAGAAQPFVVAALHRWLSVPTMVLVPTSEEARRFHSEVAAWAGQQSETLLFPEPDTLPYEDLTVDPYIEHQRLRVVACLVRAREARGRGDDSPIIVASAGAAARKTMSPEGFGTAGHVIRRGTSVPPFDLVARWVDMGYERTSMVEVPGTFAQRGGILDVYPPHTGLPARIEFLGNMVDSIRLFDPNTQLSVEMVSEVDVVPAKEAAGGGEGTIADYLPPGSLVIEVEPRGVEAALEKLDVQARQLRAAHGDKAEWGRDSRVPYLLHGELEAELGGMRRVTLARWPSGEGSEHRLGFGAAPSYGGQLDVFVEEVKRLLRRRRTVVILSHQAARLAELLAENDVLATPVSQIDAPPEAGSLVLVAGSVSEGWTVGREVFVLTDKEIFGFVKQARAKKARPVEHKALLPDLSPGDYVVHVEHGIGRFVGMIRMQVDGAEREYLSLQYAAADRLYVPVDQADRVSRYLGSAGGTPTLTRLGTHEWERVKRRVKESAREMARELLALYATREVVPGLSFSPDTLWQQELEASFAYVETPDQMEAVNRVKEDMEKPKPMDRLVCGDVGYGKTEVALRAAFKAVMDGKQVAMLVPTTVLAQQHFDTFTERLSAFPTRVEMLSRFRSIKEQQAIIEDLKNGSIDICIGTHRLLQRDVSFKDLGLVIIDEEQRFGVAHKERLKRMRREVDVLTLSATPIPRTLHMALVGVRDMSTMETPPEERLPIKTYVSEYNGSLIREAVMRELERNGQVFFVHNRIHSIHRIAQTLRELVPEANMAIAHGRMSEEKLEQTMLDFTQGKVDVLICTTIIESGLDIPNVNTLIVNDADRLGLAQLYQLRGRVGRGNHRAYAYFLYGKGKRLTPAAEKRLQTIFEATELGGGFRIALKDLEIRGAGNLLGPEQSGHIAAVGFDLYCQLLAEAVEEARAGWLGAEGARPVMAQEALPSIDLPLSAYIPEAYVSDMGVRLDLYQRLARAKSLEEVTGLAEELRDRFGALPREVRHLFYIVELRVLAAQAGIESISRDGGEITVRTREGQLVDLARVLDQRRGVRVCSTQVRLDMGLVGGGWRGVLREIVETLAVHRRSGPGHAVLAGGPHHT